MPEPEIDLAARVVHLTSAVRSAYAAVTDELSAVQRQQLARAAIDQLAELERTAAIAPPRPSFAHGTGTNLCPPRTAGPAVTAELEATLCAVLDDAHAADTIAVAFARKEAALRNVFATLDAATARALHHRLYRDNARDGLVVRFARLGPERRARLLAFLADARRREALRRQ